MSEVELRVVITDIIPGSPAELVSRILVDIHVLTLILSHTDAPTYTFESYVSTTLNLLL